MIISITHAITQSPAPKRRARSILFNHMTTLRICGTRHTESGDIAFHVQFDLNARVWCSISHCVLIAFIESAAIAPLIVGQPLEETPNKLMNHVTHASMQHAATIRYDRTLTVWTAKVKTKERKKKWNWNSFSLILNANARTELFTKNVSMQINDKFYSMSCAFNAVCTIRVSSGDMLLLAIVLGTADSAYSPINCIRTANTSIVP